MTIRARGEFGNDCRAAPVSWTAPRMKAPSICAMLPDGDQSVPRTFQDVRRFGFDIAYVVDAAARDPGWPGLEIERVSSGRLVAALRGRLSEPGETVMLVAAGRCLDHFNWLNLVPQLASRPHCNAVLAVLAGDPQQVVATLIKGSAVGALTPVDPLGGLANRSDTANIRYDGARCQPGRPRPAVFFDRDGVINEDRGYVGDISRFAFLPGAIAGVKAANDRGALAFLVTNQSGVARGLYTEQDVAELHRHMTQEMRRQGAHFDDIRTCPHLPEGVVAAYRLACHCRKPEPGMLLDLMRVWPVDRTRSVMIGDKETDMQAARAAGLTGTLYRNGSLVDVVVAALTRD